MLYNFKQETFKIINKDNQYKLYHQAISKWSKGWTYIGSFNTRDLAETSAKRYTL